MSGAKGVRKKLYCVVSGAGLARQPLPSEVGQYIFGLIQSSDGGGGYQKHGSGLKFRIGFVLINLKVFLELQ